MRPPYYTWNNVIGVLHDLQYSFARMLYQTEQLPVAPIWNKWTFPVCQKIALFGEQKITNGR
ncbi:hypothetical protein SAMN03084138_01387 [Enterovibrio norvegicus DSM 15893]|uniref:Uncharacterized protein n=1 Tax=Enterovibrio norvegicus DSM 15893 TaxID=1121869 RepID=A0A1I5MTW1_9GAMM|nr:hypothetical protein SAMN03084138_01387 [Enterovibrio norvegicus DSM 15893]